jgi:nucleotide-binding universal stress UspA family protein
VVIGYDGSPAAERVLRETAELVSDRQALVVTVWEPGVPYELMQPTIPPAPIDIRFALEVDESLYERAQRMAEQGAAIARDLGLKAEGLAVADDTTVAATLVRLATEHDAAALAVGSHGHNGVRELILGSTSREVVTDAPCPVVLARGPKTKS